MSLSDPDGGLVRVSGFPFVVTTGGGVPYVYRSVFELPFLFTRRGWGIVHILDSLAVADTASASIFFYARRIF